MAEKFDEKIPEDVPEIKNEPAERTVIESREGEKFFAERLTSPEDPRVEKVQEILEKNFGKKEVDPFEVTKEALKETPPYLIHVVENSKGEIKGLNASAVIETVDAKGKASKESATWFDCYSFMSPDARSQGVWKELFKVQQESAMKDAENRGLKIGSFLAETHHDAEAVFNSEGMRRVYFKDKNNDMHEAPYKQLPLNWNEKTGKPAEGAGVVPEHLMIKMTSGERKISNEDLKEMVRGVYRYSNAWDREDFQTQKAYNRHAEYLKNAEAAFFKSISKQELHLLSAAERVEMQAEGIKFIEHQTEIKPKLDKEKQMAEWSGHLTGGSRGKERIEAVDRDLAQEKQDLESAKIPQKGIETDQIWKFFDKIGEVIGKGAAKLPQNQERAVEGATWKAFDKIGEGIARVGEKFQAEREAKISFLQNTKTFGKEKWGKLTEGLSHLGNPKEMGLLGLRAGKKLAIEGGKDLMMIGLSPAMAIEEASRFFARRYIGINGLTEAVLPIFRRQASIGHSLEELEGTSTETTEAHRKQMEVLKQAYQTAKEEERMVYARLYGKGKILRFLERLERR